MLFEKVVKGLRFRIYLYSDVKKQNRLHRIFNRLLYTKKLDRKRFSTFFQHCVENFIVAFIPEKFLAVLLEFFNNFVYLMLK